MARLCPQLPLPSHSQPPAMAQPSALVLLDVSVTHQPPSACHQGPSSDSLPPPVTHQSAPG